jgi:hypothetical protein
MPFDLREIARLRLRNQRVTGALLASPAEAVGWLGCVQAQEYPLAKWSVAMRVVGGRDGSVHDTGVDQALARGEILRTHILRPTWHFVAPRDIRWIMRLTGPRVLSGSAARIRFLELDDSQLARSQDVMRRALEGGKQLTRPELQAEISRAGLNADGSRAAYMFMAAEMTCLVASGAPRGGKQTYALLDEFAPPGPRDVAPFDRDAALAELTLRYFTSHGPATVADFGWWSGIGARETQRGILANGTDMERLEVDREEFWWAGDQGGSADSPPSPAVYLMQAYDEYVVAYRSPRTPINLDGLAADGVLGGLPFAHTIVSDTQVVGYWRRLTAGGGFRIEVQLLRALSTAESAALELEVERYAAFVERPVSLVIASAASA